MFHYKYLRSFISLSHACPVVSLDPVSRLRIRPLILFVRPQQWPSGFLSIRLMCGRCGVWSPVPQSTHRFQIGAGFLESSCSISLGWNAWKMGPYHPTWARWKWRVIALFGRRCSLPFKFIIITIFISISHSYKLWQTWSVCFKNVPKLMA